jgi:hypothetical protein
VNEIGVIGDKPVEFSAGVAVIEATGGTTVGVGEALDDEFDDDWSLALDPCESGAPAVDVTVVVPDSEPLLQPTSTASMATIASNRFRGVFLPGAFLRALIIVYRLIAWNVRRRKNRGQGQPIATAADRSSGQRPE